MLEKATVAAEDFVVAAMDTTMNLDTVVFACSFLTPPLTHFYVYIRACSGGRLWVWVLHLDASSPCLVCPFLQMK